MSRLRISRNFGKSGRRSLSCGDECCCRTAASARLCRQLPTGPAPDRVVLFLRPAFPEQADEMKTIVLYETPGIDRIACGRCCTTSLACFLPFLPLQGCMPLQPARKEGTGSGLPMTMPDGKGGFRVVDFWDYYSWPDFLPGRFAVLLPDLRVSFTEVHQEPFDDSLSLGRISPRAENAHP